MGKALLFVNLVLIFTASCNGRANVPYVERDTTISKNNSYSEIFLDSLFLEDFINNQHPDTNDAQRLRNFYNSRNYQYAWFTKEGLAEQTLAFWNLQQNYITLSKDSLLADSSLSASLQAFQTDDPLVKRPSPAMTELRLTMHFFKYAEHAYAGRIDPEELQWYIPRKKVNEMVLLDSLIANKGQGQESWEPLNRQYNRMKKSLEEYNGLEMSKGSDSVLLPRRMSFREGDSSAVLIQIKKRLASLKDYNSSDTSAVYNSEFVPAVKQFQRRHGLKQQSIITAPFIEALNTPVKERIRQMLINMERFRWLPKEPPGNLILVNIPEFRLRVFEGRTKTMDMDIIVGKAANKTIIFNDILKYVVFSPYWNVPSSIVRKEILPAMKTNPQYLRSKNMEITGYSGGLPVIRQLPGSSNSLGLVKFIFPNDYNIYLHDTPTKSLFREEYRAFSHGCIRLAEPEKLASYLLKDQGWTAENIKKAMQGSKENWVQLKTPVPVVITYFTAWVDKDGLLNFRDDVYGHDKKMAGLLFHSKR